MLPVCATRAKPTPNLPSLSRMRYFVPTPKAVASRRGTCSPSVSGIGCHPDVDHSARMQLDNEEGEKRAEEEVSDRKKIAGPDLLSMRVQEGVPLLSSWRGLAHGSHVLLNSPLADVKTEALSNSPRMRSAPHSRLLVAISLIKEIVSGEIFGVAEAPLDLYFQ